MAITLTNSQRAAIGRSAAEPRTVVELHTKHGVYPIAGERMMWSGVQYAPRLQNEPDLTTAIGGAQGFGVSPTKTILLSLANADGWVSTQPPDFYRYGDVIVKEILMDVPSYAVRTFKFIATGGSMPNPTTFNIQCEDFWSVLKQRSFPSNGALMTVNRFPHINDVTNDGRRSTNQPMNIVFGRALTKLTLVDDLPRGADSGGISWLVGYDGNITIPSSGRLFQYDASKMDPLQAFTARSYELRHRTTYDGIPIATLFVFESGNTGDDAVTHYLDTRGGVYGYPDEVLLFMLTNSQLGVGIDATLIDSDSLLTARSWYRSIDLTMDFSTNQQKPLGSWLDDWCRDSMTRIILRDKLYLSPQMSRAPVTSFYIGNMQRDTLSLTDILIGQEESRVTLEYRDRYKAEEENHKNVTYNVGSGSDHTYVSELIGRATVAAKVAQTIAKRGADGIRAYQYGSTLRVADVEEGDLVTVKHPAMCNSNEQPHWVEVEQIRRANGLLNFSVREVNSRMFRFGNLPGDSSIDLICPDFTVHAVNPYSWGNVSSGVGDVLVVSHTLGIAPETVDHKWTYIPAWNVTNPWAIDRTASWTAYNTASTCALKVTMSLQSPTLSGDVFIGTTYHDGWDLSGSLECPPDDPPPDPAPPEEPAVDAGDFVLGGTWTTVEGDEVGSGQGQSLDGYFFRYFSDFATTDMEYAMPRAVTFKSIAGLIRQIDGGTVTAQFVVNSVIQSSIVLSGSVLMAPLLATGTVACNTGDLAYVSFHIDSGHYAEMNWSIGYTEVS